jgi:serine/threonine protein kinase
MANDNDDAKTEPVAGFDGNRDRPRIDRLGQYRILSTLGSGGMATIYRAHDDSMKREIALKVLHSSQGLSSDAQSRFIREAWIAGQLNHPLDSTRIPESTDHV